LKAGLAGYAPDMTDLHEYWSLSIAGSAPWYALRHVEAIRRGLLPTSWPIIIGECGSDNVGTEDGQRRSGWSDRGKLSADQECTNLAAYLAGCAPSVQAVYVFGDGGSDQRWDSYRTFGTPVEAYIRSTWQNPPQSLQDGGTTPATPKEASMDPALLAWVSGVLSGIHAPMSQTTRAMLVAWAAAEGGLPHNNPLNTTQVMPGSTDFNVNNGYPVQAYPDIATGIAATVKTLLNGYYGAIVADLVDGNVAPFAAHVYASPWGTTQGIDVAAALAASIKTPSGGVQDGSGSPVTPKGTPMPVNDPAAVVAQDQGANNLCWDVAVAECVAAAGGSVDINALYRAVKVVDYVAPGLEANFSELIHSITYAAGVNGWTVQWWGADGRLNDWTAFEQAVRAGSYYSIAGVKGGDLGLGNFGHFEAVKSIYTAPDGTEMVQVADSYARYDNAGWQPAYSLQQYLQAMRDNWDANTDAVAWRFALPATVSPTPEPGKVAAPVPATAGIPADEQAAYAYYTSTGIGIDRTHALWTATLLPMYRKWEAMAAANDPLADLYHPGPLAGPETGARWGGTQPAAVVKLTNETVGAYLSKSWCMVAVQARGSLARARYPHPRTPAHPRVPGAAGPGRRARTVTGLKRKERPCPRS
ncbi:MAG TPA: hypothetical protein VIO16_10445, partial [Dehalococcoidia bacterium]